MEPPPARPQPDGPAIRLEGVTKRFGNVVAVREVSLEIGRGEFFSLLGPSGCGKTTLLRILAGFERPDGGRVFIDGRDVTDVPPQQRPTAMVFQNYALFPHMTVGENVGYGLRVRKVGRAERERRVAEALGRVDLAAYAARPVTQLSGGQQQRVALARALAVAPSVILFDEPLSNLDVALREQTRRELKLLQHALGTTSVYVTHDQQEALALSDRIAVMRAGVFQQVGTPEVLYRAPDTAFVAQFLGGSNLIRDAQLAARLAGGPPPTAGLVLAVRPEHLRPAPTGTGLPARLRDRQFLGTYTEWWADADGVPLRAWVDPAAEPADTVYLEATQHRWVREG
jgi:ABC-type Fe3+/spermidine/putrescine transport system ATPase subunit